MAVRKVCATVIAPKRGECEPLTKDLEWQQQQLCTLNAPLKHDEHSLTSIEVKMEYSDDEDELYSRPDGRGVIDKDASNISREDVFQLLFPPSNGREHGEQCSKKTNSHSDPDKVDESISAEMKEHMYERGQMCSIKEEVCEEENGASSRSNSENLFESVQTSAEVCIPCLIGQILH